MALFRKWPGRCEIIISEPMPNARRYKANFVLKLLRDAAKAWRLRGQRQNRSN